MSAGNEFPLKYQSTMDRLYILNENGKYIKNADFSFIKSIFYLYKVVLFIFFVGRIILLIILE